MKSRLKTLLVAVMTVATLALSTPVVHAADAAYMRIAAADELAGRLLNLGLNKSMVIDVPEDIVDVLISNPAIATRWSAPSARST
ncbi:hypothetical protein [Methylobrevis pamukkalensis]|uniref:Uncharacterized protein n=1 Tax=Methylobrevis pamukkalensis TaxID=1439726 RepID=A0A1E3H552_9HYPH|nr:hypothetical protein [Methylobrevis pamukkalensis]ODN70906.1 hypothetical protein A6302_01750 [Methylobrevis pamukkalensis]